MNCYTKITENHSRSDKTPTLSKMKESEIDPFIQLSNTSIEKLVPYNNRKSLNPLFLFRTPEHKAQKGVQLVQLLLNQKHSAG